MHTDFLKKKFAEYSEKTAVICGENSYSYKSLLENINFLKENLSQNYGIGSGTTAALEGDFSFNSVSILLALAELDCIIIPLNYRNSKNRNELIGISKPEFVISVNENDQFEITKNDVYNRHELIEILRDRKHPGLILFSSGTSGKPKAAVHDFTGLLKKFEKKRDAYITMNFLLFDHWGGLNTLFHTLSNGGTAVTVFERTPDYICSLIERHRVELLPASPTFLNLLLISEANKRHNLSSLKIISYGTEPMSESTLKSLNKAFPGVKFRQTYGLIEVGVLRTKSKDDGSLWLKLGGEGFDVRVSENILQIKSESAILGYLNYPAPFTSDGYFITGDYAETDGDYYRIIGRKSDLINIGGEKVFPVEIENVIREIENVAEVMVYGEKNPITGSIICADVSLIKPEDKVKFRSRLKKFCRDRLQGYKIPAKINIVESINISERFKKKHIPK